MARDVGLKEAGETWKIDRHIPLAIIISIAMQTVCVIWFFSKLDSRVSYLEEWHSTKNADSELLIRMDERLRVLSEKVANIDKKIEGVR